VVEKTLAASAACLCIPPPVSLPRCCGLFLSTILRDGTAEIRDGGGQDGVHCKGNAK
jgi:hypothetical protein